MPQQLKVGGTLITRPESIPCLCYRQITVESAHSPGTPNLW